VWNKTPESIFQITRAGEVLNKYVMGVWQARRQDFAAKGPKTTRGVTFFKYIGYMQQPGPNMKWEAQILNVGLGTTGPPLATALKYGQIHRCLFR